MATQTQKRPEYTREELAELLAPAFWLAGRHGYRVELTEDRQVRTWQPGIDGPRSVRVEDPWEFSRRIVRLDELENG